MKCTVCNHPQRRDIDLALLSGRHTLKSLQQQYGPGKSSLFRHRKHLVAKLRQSQEDLESSRQQVSLLKLNAFLDHVQRGVETAAAEGDLDRVFKGSHIGSRIIHQINHLDVPLELDTVYRLISAPGFVSQDSLLPVGPQIITDLHQALVDKAFFPCPEPPPDIVAVDENDHDALHSAPETAHDYDDDADQEVDDYESVVAAGATAAADISDSFLSTQNSQREALRLLQRHFPDLDLSAAALPLAEKEPKLERDTSATVARQTDFCPDNISQNQLDSQCEKNLPKHSAVGRESTRKGGEAQAPPANAAAPLPPDSLETQNSELESAFPETDTDPSSLIPDPCFLETENRKPKTENGLLTEPLDETAARADDLFEITHGYKRNNPPKHIPNRRWEEDFRSSSIFGDPRKIWG